MDWKSELSAMVMGLKYTSFNERENCASVFNLIGAEDAVTFIDAIMKTITNGSLKNKLEKIKLEILTAQIAVEVLKDIVEE